MTHTTRKTVYLTKERLNRAAKQGVHEASRRAKKTASSLVTVKEGWIVREHNDGSLEKIEKLAKVSDRELNRKVKKLAHG